MTFEQCFDFWLAKKVNDLLKEGFTFSQTKMLMDLTFFELFDCIDDKNLLYLIKKKFETTLELFSEGVKNEQTN